MSSGFWLYPIGFPKYVNGNFKILQLNTLIYSSMVARFKPNVETTFEKKI